MIRKIKNFFILITIALSSSRAYAGIPDYYEINFQRDVIVGSLHKGFKIDQKDFDYLLQLLKEGNDIEPKEVYLEGGQPDQTLHDYYLTMVKGLYSYHFSASSQEIENAIAFIDGIFYSDKFINKYSEEVIGTALHIITLHL